MISGVQHSVQMMQATVDKWGSDLIKAAINYNIDHSERLFREEVSRWPDGSYEADVYIDHDTQGTRDIRVHVACTMQGDQLTVDLTGTDDRQELVGVWNTFGNSRSYVMTQLAAMVDPSIVKNEGLFHAIDIIIPEGCIAHPPPNKPAALGSFHPACEITEAVCVALSGIVPERCAAGLQNRHAQCGNRFLRQWRDVDGSGGRCPRHGCLGVKGIDGWGSCPSALGNLLLSEAEDAESRFPIINISREMTTDGGGAGQWRGQPGSLNVKKVLEPTMAMAWMVSAAHTLRGMCGGDDAQCLYQPL
jgi:N-methylhydantoinase B